MERGKRPTEGAQCWRSCWAFSIKNKNKGEKNYFGKKKKYKLCHKQLQGPWPTSGGEGVEGSQGEAWWASCRSTLWEGRLESVDLHIQHFCVSANWCKSGGGWWENFLGGILDRIVERQELRLVSGEVLDSTTFLKKGKPAREKASIYWMVVDLVLLFSQSVMSDSVVTPWTIACQAPLSMGFPRQEYWSGLPFPFPGESSWPRIEPESPALQADSLPLSHLDKMFINSRSCRRWFWLLKVSGRGSWAKW